MAFDGGHSLERIFLTLSDSCPLPVGWACLRQPKDEQNILFAHVTVDDQLRVKCDRTILLSPMMTEKSSCLVQVTFTDSSSSTPSNSTSLLIRDLTDVSNLLRVSFKGEDSSPLKKVAKKSTGSPNRPSGVKRDLECDVEVDRVDSPVVKRSKSPSPVASSSDVSNEATSSVMVEPVTMSTAANSRFNSSSSVASSFDPSASSNQSMFKNKPAPSQPFKFAADKERPYKCPECDKTFTRGNHLKDHMRLHAGETYECPVCQYQCILQTKFTHHLTSHNYQGPFPCAQCGKTFDRAHDLARHLPVDHQIDTGFRLSHFKNNFSPAQFKDKSAMPPNLLSIAGAGRPSFSSPSSTPSFSSPSFVPPFPRPFQHKVVRPSLPSHLPSISSNPVNITDFGDGSFEDMQRLMRLYGGGDSGSGGGANGDDGDDSVIPLDDEEYSRVKSLDDEFGDDAILVE